MVVLLGRVGRTPELGKNTEHPVITFPMATAQNLKNADGNDRIMYLCVICKFVYPML